MQHANLLNMFTENNAFYLDSRKFLDFHCDRVPHLLQELGDMVRGHVLVTGSLRLPGFNDGKRIASKLFEQAGRDTAGTFLNIKTIYTLLALWSFVPQYYLLF